MATINSAYKSFFGSVTDALEANAGTTSTTPLIDIDKAKQAFAASTLCQHTFFKPGTEVNREMLCAVSALVVYAGMTPELWGSLVTDGGTIWQFARPILQKHYNIPAYLTREIPGVFDRQPNEWKAVQAVLDLFETYNKTILHAQATEEDAQRFPQQGPVEMWTVTGMAQEFRSSDFWIAPSPYYSEKYADMLLGEPGKIVKTPSATKSLIEQEQILNAMAAKQRKLEKVTGLKSMWRSPVL